MMKLVMVWVVAGAVESLGEWLRLGRRLEVKTSMVGDDAYNSYKL
jgi:hypothetical protein